MRTSHEHLMLNNVHFNAFVEVMGDCLNVLKIPYELQEVLVGVLESFRKHVVWVKVSLFEQLGGEKGISLVVDRFYNKIIKEPLLKGFFDGKNVEKIKEKFK
jgi:truncated hemoglobin YjbI